MLGVSIPAGCKPAHVRFLRDAGQQAVKVAHVIVFARGGHVGKLVRFDKVDAAQL